jgi:hypothetical protein
MFEGIEARINFKASAMKGWSFMALGLASDWRLKVSIWFTSSLARLPAVRISAAFSWAGLSAGKSSINISPYPIRGDSRLLKS